MCDHIYIYASIDYSYVFCRYTYLSTFKYKGTITLVYHALYIIYAHDYIVPSKFVHTPQRVQKRDRDKYHTNFLGKPMLQIQIRCAVSRNMCYFMVFGDSHCPHIHKAKDAVHACMYINIYI